MSNFNKRTNRPMAISAGILLAAIGLLLLSYDINTVQSMRSSTAPSTDVGLNLPLSNSDDDPIISDQRDDCPDGIKTHVVYDFIASHSIVGPVDVPIISECLDNRQAEVLAMKLIVENITRINDHNNLIDAKVAELRQDADVQTIVQWLCASGIDSRYWWSELSENEATWEAIHSFTRRLLSNDVLYMDPPPFVYAVGRPGEAADELADYVGPLIGLDNATLSCEVSATSPSEASPGYANDGWGNVPE